MKKHVAEARGLTVVVMGMCAIFLVYFEGQIADWPVTREEFSLNTLHLFRIENILLSCAIFYSSLRLFFPVGKIEEVGEKLLTLTARWSLIFGLGTGAFSLYLLMFQQGVGGFDAQLGMVYLNMLWPMSIILLISALIFGVWGVCRSFCNLKFEIEFEAADYQMGL